jgi:polysaccharide pyruvyl transferase WcaK-like protein
MIFHIFANRSNIGDWLSAKGIQKLLSPHEMTECLCDRPFISETIKLLKNANENDLIIIGGGGLLMDYFTPFWKKFQPFADGIPFFIWGIGYCDIKFENTLPPDSLIKNIIHKSKLCFVRDELSRSYLSECNLPPSVPCPSLNFIEPFEEKGNDLLHVVNYTTAGAEIYRAMCKAAKEFARINGRTYREVNNRINPGTEQELDKMLSLYKKSGIVLSSALHGCIIAVALGLKVLAVSGDRKIEAFMQSVGLEDWVLDLNETDKIPQKLNELHFQKKVTGLVELHRHKNELIADQILGFINSK